MDFGENEHNHLSETHAQMTIIVISGEIAISD